MTRTNINDECLIQKTKKGKVFAAIDRNQNTPEALAIVSEDEANNFTSRITWMAASCNEDVRFSPP